MYQGIPASASARPARMRRRRAAHDLSAGGRLCADGAPALLWVILNQQIAGALNGPGSTRMSWTARLAGGSRRVLSPQGLLVFRIPLGLRW
jgi:hypothetical protein